MFNNDVEDYKAAADNRLTNLSNLDKIVSRLMNKQFVHTGVQTEGDWLERVEKNILKDFKTRQILYKIKSF